MALADEIRGIVFAFDRNDSRRQDVRDLADRVAQVEAWRPSREALANEIEGVLMSHGFRPYDGTISPAAYAIADEVLREIEGVALLEPLLAAVGDVENYVTTGIIYEGRKLEVTLRVHPDGKSPYDLLSEKDAEIAALRSRFHLPAAVAAFMRAAGQAMPERPTVPSDEAVVLRLRLLLEEVEELVTACGYGNARVAERFAQIADEFVDAKPNVDLVEVADALADIDFVNAGTHLAFGFDQDALGAEVTRSNATKDFTNVPAGGKVTKGPAYSPPDIAAVLGLGPKEAA